MDERTLFARQMAIIEGMKDTLNDPRLHQLTLSELESISDNLSYEIEKFLEHKNG